jgi:predicted MFS family arabinose efflux permease
LLSLGFFACGFQVVFIAVHLPAFLADEGVDVSVATVVLALIGLVNILGSYLAGLWGGRMRKPMLLSWIYLARGALIAGFVLMPVTAVSAYIFGALMGLFWLSTVPLTNGTVASLWGVKHMSMLGGIVFFAHQLGSFAGGWMGGWLYDRTGNYDMAWGVAIGLSVLAAALNWPISERPEGKVA